MADILFTEFDDKEVRDFLNNIITKYMSLTIKLKYINILLYNLS